MSDLDDALVDIRALKHQIARATEFRGYGPAAVGATAGLALLTAALQAWLVPDPLADILGYVGLWSGAALASLLLVGVEAVRRARRVHVGLADDMIRAAAEQFAPAVVAGGLLTLVIVEWVPSAWWLLPGLWQILFSLGVFASCRSLPAPSVLVGVWYLVAGLTLVARGPEAALSPWSMGLVFAVGQSLGALMLHRHGAHHGEA
jgi:hypothetical protein